VGGFYNISVNLCYQAEKAFVLKQGFFAGKGMKVEDISSDSCAI